MVKLYYIQPLKAWIKMKLSSFGSNLQILHVLHKQIKLTLFPNKEKEKNDKQINFYGLTQ